MARKLLKNRRMLERLRSQVEADPNGQDETMWTSVKPITTVPHNTFNMFKSMRA